MDLVLQSREAEHYWNLWGKIEIKYQKHNKQLHQDQ